MIPSQIAIRPDRTPLIPVDAIEHHVGDLSATMGAQVTLGDVRRELARHDQWLPIDGADSLAVGEAVALNSTGPLRLGYGAWRDLLLGVQCVNHRGELITAGGRTVKNVAGYDLTKLMVGQGDDLGRIVTVTTRTYRRPTHALRVRFDPGQGVGELFPTPLRPQWAILTADQLLLGYLGDERTIAYIQRDLAGTGPRDIAQQPVEADIALRAELWAWPRDGAARLAVPPAKVAAVAAELSIEGWIADPAFGVLLAPEGQSLAGNVRGVLLTANRLVPLGLNEDETRMAERIRAAMGSPHGE